VNGEPQNVYLPTRDDIARGTVEHELGKAGLCETWEQLRARVGTLRADDRRFLEAMVDSGKAGRAGNRYFPARWVTTRGQQ
jgi:hypothetical protein